jgi:hypothetical protein
MKPRRVAIACQGGGIHGAFSCGVLTKILRVKEDEENGKLPAGAQRRFDVCGLSGTSAGALNAFMVWYGLMLKDGEAGRFAEARRAVTNLWETFRVQKCGEAAMNQFAQLMFGLQEFGLSIKHPRPALFHDWLMTALAGWSTTENLVLPKLDFGEIRPITMSKQWSDKLYPASKFDRDPASVNSLRDHGQKRGEDFLKLWFTTRDLSTLQWPQNAFEAHTKQLAEPATG